MITLSEITEIGLNFKTHIIKVHETLFIAWVDDFKGLVVQGSSLMDIRKELLISLKVKIAYDLNLEIKK